jgi:hypothetical protein
MAGGAESDALGGDGRIRLAGEIGRHQPRHVDQQGRIDGFAGQRTHMSSHLFSFAHQEPRRGATVAGVRTHGMF